MAKHYYPIKKLIYITLVSLFFQSCDYGLGLYVRNYEESPINIKVKYIDRAGFDPLDSIRYSDKLIASDLLKQDSLDKSIKVFREDSVHYEINLPETSTSYFEPIYLGYNIEYVIINDLDSIWIITDKNGIMDNLKENELYEEHFKFAWTKLILNIKMDELKRAITRGHSQ